MCHEAAKNKKACKPSYFVCIFLFWSCIPIKKYNVVSLGMGFDRLTACSWCGAKWVKGNTYWSLAAVFLPLGAWVGAELPHSPWEVSSPHTEPPPHTAEVEVEPDPHAVAWDRVIVCNNPKVSIPFTSRWYYGQGKHPPCPTPSAPRCLQSSTNVSLIKTNCSWPLRVERQPFSFPLHFPLGYQCNNALLCPRKRLHLNLTSCMSTRSRSLLWNNHLKISCERFEELSWQGQTRAGKTSGERNYHTLM